jgi:hypothetical protein
MDPTIEEKIASAVDHGPEFSDEECARIETLELRHAQTFDGLERLVGLRELVIIGCNARNLRPLGHAAARPACGRLYPDYRSVPARRVSGARQS